MPGATLHVCSKQPPVFEQLKRFQPPGKMLLDTADQFGRTPFEKGDQILVEPLNIDEVPAVVRLMNAAAVNSVLHAVNPAACAMKSLGQPQHQIKIFVQLQRGIELPDRLERLTGNQRVPRGLPQHEHDFAKDVSMVKLGIAVMASSFIDMNDFYLRIGPSGFWILPKQSHFLFQFCRFEDVIAVEPGNIVTGNMAKTIIAIPRNTDVGLMQNRFDLIGVERGVFEDQIAGIIRGRIVTDQNLVWRQSLGADTLQRLLEIFFLVIRRDDYAEFVHGGPLISSAAQPRNRTSQLPESFDKLLYRDISQSVGWR